MVKAYVLIETSAGRSRNLVNSMKGSPGVVETVRVTGPYDVVAILEGESIEALSNVVNERIHSVEGVIRTTTCVVLQ